MKRKKIHIDELFKQGLKNLSLFVSNKDMEAIDGKKNIFENPKDELKSTAFSDFELEVGESDWLATKAKLDIEKTAMAQDGLFAAGFSEFEIPVPAEDWTSTFQKYKDQKRRRRIWAWTGTGLFVLLLAFLSFLMIDFDSETLKSNKQALESSPSHEKVENPINQNPLESNSNKASNALPNESEKIASPNHSKPEAIVGGKTNAVSPKAKTEISPEKSLTATPALKPAVLASETASNTIKPTSKDKTSAPESIAAMEANKNTGSQGKVPVITDNTKTNAGNAATIESLTQRQLPNPSPAEVKKAESRMDEKGVEKAESIQELLENQALDTPKKSKDEVKPPLPKAKIQFYAGLVNGFAMTHRKLASSNDAFYNTIRNAAEKPIFQWRAGFEFGVQKNGLQISLGAQSTTEAWQSNYDFKYRVHDSIPLWNPGRTQIIGYFLVNGRDTSIQERQVIKVQKVEFPVQISGLIPINDKVKLVLGGGLVFNYNMKTSGDKILNPLNNQLTHYSLLMNQERSFNVSPQLNLGAQFKLPGRLALQTSFNGQMAAYSRFKEGFGAKDQPYSFGINIKLLYLLQ